MTDQNRKTLRSFYCRDYLWEHFEQMAQELGCSMDYLINESMRLYARDRGQSPQGEAGGVQQPGPADPQRGGSRPGGRGQQNPAQQQPGPVASQSQSQPVATTTGAGGDRQRSGHSPSRGGDGGDNHRTFQQVPAVGKNNRSQPPAQGGPGQPASGPAPADNAGGPPPPPPRPGSGAGQPGQSSGNPGHSGSQNWQQNQSGPPQPPGGNYGNEPGYGADTGAGQSPVYLSFNNNRYVIDQQKYVIGRGSKQTDLTIRDGNISRKHCAIIYRNGSYYIKDLDSTNGVEYRGNRIESKKIEESDVFYLCDYELRFSFRG